MRLEFQGRPLFVVSNRLPFTIRASGRGRRTATPGSGGLVTALLPVLRHRGGVWIGWSGLPGPARPVRAALAAAGKTAGCELEAVALSDRVLVMSRRPGRIIEEIAVEMPDRGNPIRRRQDERLGGYVARLMTLLDVGRGAV